VFPDNWIYIHDPAVRVGRIQNFKNWSPDMVPDAGTTCLGLEYFCFEGDGLWNMLDGDLVALATTELAHLGICSPSQVFDGVVVRQPKAYPVYDDSYQANVGIVRDYLMSSLPNLHLAGRNGMHKYNNQDHSMTMNTIPSTPRPTASGVDLTTSRNVAKRGRPAQRRCSTTRTGRGDRTGSTAGGSARSRRPRFRTGPRRRRTRGRERHS